ncbi:MAG: FCD domain-containing protein [Deltaproteobacteria bacterium]|nr:FCD domain-containing protein [Deltaproteobacteria bacterium]
MNQEGFKTGDVLIEHNPNPNLHNVIAEITGNHLLIILMEVLMGITTHRFSSIKLDTKTQKAIAGGHKNIADAIAKKDEESAFEAMKQHVLSVYKTHTVLEKKRSSH